jgi:formate hydrogenlyase subunit 4
MNLVVGYALSLLLYPGGLFALIAGWLLFWLREALAAQRRGEPMPRLLQPVQDIFKLFNKSASFPAHSEAPARAVPRLLALAPLVALVLLPVPGNSAFSTAVTTGDLLAVTLLLLLPALMPFVLGHLIHSPLAQIAAERATRRAFLLIGGVLLSTLAVAAQRGSLDLSVLVAQQSHPTAASVTLAVLAGLLFYACLPALLARQPWGWFQRDLQVIAGLFTDLAGADLALLQLGALGQQVAVISLPAVLYILPFVPGGEATHLAVYLATLVVGAALTGLARGSRRYSFAR